MDGFFSPIEALRPVSEFLETPRWKRPIEGAQSESFASLFTNLLGSVNQTELDDHASSFQLAAGNINDLASILLDAEKADVQLRMTTAIRNKVVDAYTEIMRMTL